ncbi:MAG: class I tRNA ligase family protein, partial [Limnochordia bacterium]
APQAHRRALCDFLVVLAPFAPHIAEELWEQMGHADSIFKARWPEADPALAQAQTVEIPVQVNGRVRAVLEVEKGLDEPAVLDSAREAVKDHLDGKVIVRTIYVTDKVINFVVR